MGCEMGKIEVIMNKPVYLRQAILDLSKLVMYEFHYDYMIPKYRAAVPRHGPENLKLCYMDTDSLVYHIKMKDFMPTSLEMSRKDSIGVDTMPQMTDHCPWE